MLRTGDAVARPRRPGRAPSEVARVKMSTSMPRGGQPPGQLDDVDVHAAGVAGARLVERRGVQADHRQPLQLGPRRPPCTLRGVGLLPDRNPRVSRSHSRGTRPACSAACAPREWRRGASSPACRRRRASEPATQPTADQPRRRRRRPTGRRTARASSATTDQTSGGKADADEHPQRQQRRADQRRRRSRAGRRRAAPRPPSSRASTEPCGRRRRRGPPGRPRTGRPSDAGDAGEAQRQRVTIDPTVCHRQWRPSEHPAGRIRP